MKKTLISGMILLTLTITSSFTHAHKIAVGIKQVMIGQKKKVLLIQMTAVEIQIHLLRVAKLLLVKSQKKNFVPSNQRKIHQMNQKIMMAKKATNRKSILAYQN